MKPKPKTTTIKKMKPRPPKKLWKALRLGLDDLAKAERSKRFEVNMSEWLVTNGKCEVCLAGSVMALSLDGVKKCKAEGALFGECGTMRRRIEEDAFGPEWMVVFLALDFMRAGHWALAWEYIYRQRQSGCRVPETVHCLPCPPVYCNDPKAWRRVMEDACAVLKKAGI